MLRREEAEGEVEREQHQDRGRSRPSLRFTTRNAPSSPNTAPEAPSEGWLGGLKAYDAALPPRADTR